MNDFKQSAEDIVVACADLVGRAGEGFEIGYLHDDVPAEEAGWYAHATYQGTRITVEDHTSPAAAAYALSARLLSGATCRCGKPVVVSVFEQGCRWQLVGQAWTPSCTGPSLKVDAPAGDLKAAQEAINQVQRRNKVMKPDGYIELRLNGATYKYKFADIEWWTKDETGITVRFEDSRVFYPWTSVFSLSVQMNSEDYRKWAREEAADSDSGPGSDLPNSDIWVCQSDHYRLPVSSQL